MQRNEVIEFLEKIDRHIALKHQDILGAEKFRLKIIGKCALLLSGLADSRGTVDMDSLQVAGHPDPHISETIKSSLLLHSNDTVASKCFSAFASPPRRKDMQDIVSAFDQKIAEINAVIILAGQIFKSYFEDARSDRFPAVHKFITEELIPNYGGTSLNFQLDDV